MRFVILAAAMLASSSPVVAQDENSGSTESTEAVAADLTTFGQWLLRLGEIQQPIQLAFADFGPRWRAAMEAGPDAGAVQFGAVIATALTTIDRANAQLEALATPQIGFGLPDELQPRTLRADTLRINRELRSAVMGFGPILEAVRRNDEEVALTGLNRMMSALRLIVESRMLTTRGMMEVTPREEATWDAMNIQYLLFQALSRALAAWPRAMEMTRDASLPSDLLRLAGELESSAEAGSRKAEEDERNFRAAVAEANDNRDPAELGLLQRAHATLRIERTYFPLGRQLAQMLRRHASTIADQPVTIDQLATLFREIQTIRQQMDEVDRQMSSTLAGTS